MRIMWITVMSLVIGCAMAISPLQAGQRGAPVPFSADWVASEEGQPQEQGSFYAAPEGIRMEGVSGGEPFIMIFNLKKEVAWHVIESQRMYMETPIDSDQPESREDVMGGLGVFGSPCPEDAKANRVGPETLHGRKVEKWTCEVPGEERLTVWYDSRLQATIRTEDEDGVFELRNIQEGPLPDALFLPPAGYTKFSMPGSPG